jgi:hypothetical protein
MAANCKKTAEAAPPPPVVDGPDANSLQEFQNQVKLWMEHNATIAQLQEQIRNRRKFKNQLSEQIMAFMSRYQFDKLKTREGGKLIYKMSYVSPPLTLKTIRERIETALQLEAPEKCMELSATVFRREALPKPSLSLRRVKITTQE